MNVTLHQAAAKSYDLCILGGGPAGIILGREYARRTKGCTILILEYGEKRGTIKNRLDDSICVTNRVNHHDPYECTNKGLGGTTATWGGRCVMYDEVDFIDRPVLRGGCTWDTNTFREAQRYVPLAAKYFDCGTGPFNLDEMPDYRGRRISDCFVPGPITDNVIERWSLPTRFGKKFREELRNSASIDLLEGVEARRFTMSDDGRRVSAVEVHDIGERTARVHAKTVVLAAGAQESTRLLLRNPHVFARVGGPPYALGRFYQGHVSGKIASVRFYGDPTKTEYGFLRDAQGAYLRRRLQMTTETLVRENLLNTAVWLDNPLYFDPNHRSGAMSLMYLAMITPVLGRKLAPPAIAHSVTKGMVTGLPGHLSNIVRTFPGSVVTPSCLFFERYCRERKLPGVFLYSPKNRYALHFHAEQVPDAENRMEIGNDGETLVIHYRLTNDDVSSVTRFHEVLNRWLRDSNCGELEYWYPRSSLPERIRCMSRDGIHQVGTTRIADTPADGVVDRDLRVFGTDNLFVCSSSVFPTSGQANPTFFLGVLAARLAKTLSQVHAIR